MSKRRFLLILLLCVIILFGCNSNIENPDNGESGDGTLGNEHECVESDWIDDEEFTCGESGYQYTELSLQDFAPCVIPIPIKKPHFLLSFALSARRSFHWRFCAHFRVSWQERSGCLRSP